MTDQALTDHDVYLFKEGRHFLLPDKLGSHPEPGGGTRFAVWAPTADYVSVIGDFNGWDGARSPLRPRGSSGIWEGVVAGIGPGDRYKYRITGHRGGAVPDKADPFAQQTETPPYTASIVAGGQAYSWADEGWMRGRSNRNSGTAPWTIYELHGGSFARAESEGWRSLSYRELAHRVADHVERLGFTHVELLPVMEHPFYGSWGYQVTSYFAPTGRYGTPDDLRYFVDHLHQRGIGVIFDWVPSHFPGDDHGLHAFDGSPIYEYPDPRMGFHPEWTSWIFDYGRPEVRSFLISSALFWLREFHADGLRVDGVASMLYLDYARRPGEWLPNRFGGREHLQAVDFLRQLNSEVYRVHPDVQTIAEESTAWPGVSRPVYLGGLGFGMKWDMGWMHDTLAYFEHDPVHRRWHHGQLTFRGVYAFTENFVLPLSHDEVVYGKGSLYGKMPGDPWQKLANLRLLFGYMFATPGKKLLFMGGELGQPSEWAHEGSVDWGLEQDPGHGGVERWVSDLAGFYRSEPAMHARDFDPSGFEWVDANDAEQSVFTFLRRDGPRFVLIACNATPVPRHGYRVGVPHGGRWAEALNSDAEVYGGSGVGNLGGVDAEEVPHHGRSHSVVLSLPPLGAVLLRPEEPARHDVPV